MEKALEVNNTLLKYLFFCIYACAFLSNILTTTVLNIESQNCIIRLKMTSPFITDVKQKFKD